MHAHIYPFAETHIEKFEICGVIRHKWRMKYKIRQHAGVAELSGRNRGAKRNKDSKKMHTQYEEERKATMTGCKYKREVNIGKDRVVAPVVENETVNA